MIALEVHIVRQQFVCSATGMIIIYFLNNTVTANCTDQYNKVIGRLGAVAFMVYLFIIQCIYSFKVILP